MNAVRQADHQPAHPTSPGVDWAPLEDGEEHEPGVREDPPARDGAPAAALRMPDDPLPETGGSVPGLLVALALGGALLLRRVRA